MPITRIKMKPGSWEGSASSQRNGLLYEVIRREYSATYLAHTNHPVFGVEQILTDPACFQIGQAYAIFEDSDTVATCVNVNPRATNNPKLWEIDVQFDTDRVVSAITDNPLNQPADIRWSFVKAERPLLVSADGVPVTNSSIENFDPALTYEEIRPLLTIVRNEASFSVANAYAYHNCLNAEPFAGAPVLCAKINSITGQRQISNGILYWQVTYEIEFRKENFAYLVLDQGFRDIDKRLFRDPIDFAPLSNETLLNGRGRKRSDAIGSLLTGVVSPGDTFINFTNRSLFPPGKEVENGEGYSPSGDWTFNIRINKEVMTVIGDKDTILNPLTDVEVLRAQAGTEEGFAHISGTPVYLEPYYKRFIPFAVKSFTPLDLPTI